MLRVRPSNQVVMRWPAEILILVIKQYVYTVTRPRGIELPCSLYAFPKAVYCSNNFSIYLDCGFDGSSQGIRHGFAPSMLFSIPTSTALLVHSSLRGRPHLQIKT